jgi:tetratricopeptide (TPR) repeat protein
VEEDRQTPHSQRSTSSASNVAARRVLPEFHGRIGTLLDIFRARLTGAQKVCLDPQEGAAAGAEAASALLWFVKGRLVWVSAVERAHESLGRILYGHSVLTPEQYTNALDLFCDSAEGRLGDVLVRKKYVSAEQLGVGIGLQLACKAADWLLAGTSALPPFEADVALPAGERAFPVTHFDFLFALTKRHSRSQLSTMLPSWFREDRFVQSALPSDASSPCFGAEMQKLWPDGLLDGGSSIDEILPSSGQLRHARMASLVALYLAGYAQSSAAAFDGAPSRDSTETLDLDDSAVRALGPVTRKVATLRRDELEEAGTLGRVKLHRVTVSLFRVPKRDPRSPREARLLAEIHYVNGRSLMFVSNWQRAKESFASAEQLWPACLEYALLRRVCEANEREVSHDVSSLNLLAEMLDADPFCPAAIFTHACLCMETGDDESALTAFELALAVEPRFPEATQKLKVLRKRVAHAEGRDTPISTETLALTRETPTSSEGFDGTNIRSTERLNAGPTAQAEAQAAPIQAAPLAQVEASSVAEASAPAVQPRGVSQRPRLSPEVQELQGLAPIEVDIPARPSAAPRRSSEDKAASSGAPPRPAHPTQPQSLMDALKGNTVFWVAITVVMLIGSYLLLSR